LATLRTGAKMEALAAQEILSRINSSAQIQGMPNLKTADTVYRKNPKLVDFYRLRFKGIKI
ncbi:MAG: formyltransferase family protein, partial [Pseudobdellovibrionaceae bacterium]